MKQSDRKRETKTHLQEAASRQFKLNGYDGAGVDGIASSAGATSGAFYAHLRSKDAAFQDALVRGLDEVLDAIPKYQAEHGDEWVRVFADYYLGASHRNHADGGCAMTAMAPDVVRGSIEFKGLYEKKIALIVDTISSGLPVKEPAGQKAARAWSYLSVLIGGLTLARSFAHTQLADTVARSAADTAVDIVTNGKTS